MADEKTQGTNIHIEFFPRFKVYVLLEGIRNFSSNNIDWCQNIFIIDYKYLSGMRFVLELTWEGTLLLEAITKNCLWASRASFTSFAYNI